METLLIFKDLKDFPTQNIMLREHFTKRAKRKEKLIWLIKLQTKNKHIGTVKIEYSRYACQLQDWDNHCASFKIVGDALVKCGLIKDDNPNVVLEFIPIQCKVSKREQEKIAIRIIDSIFKQIH